jgi:hypothetical protein
MTPEKIESCLDTLAAEINRELGLYEQAMDRLLDFGAKVERLRSEVQGTRLAAEAFSSRERRTSDYCDTHGVAARLSERRRRRIA